MKTIVAVLALCCVVYSQRYTPYTSSGLNNVPILKYAYEPNPDGSYFFEYQTGNGISAQERGRLVNQDSQVKEGSYDYTAPDGQHFAISYVADENGFRPVGAHIPTPPPIPVAIQRSLAYNAAHPEPQGRYYRK